MNNSVFMVITHITKPIAGANMSRKETAANPDSWETTESMILVDRVPKNKVYTASIILDLLNGKVIKNRFDVADATVFREYMNRYSEDVTDALKMWGAKSPANFARLKEVAKFAQHEAAKLEAASQLETEKAETNDTANSD